MSRRQTRKNPFGEPTDYNPQQTNYDDGYNNEIHEDPSFEEVSRTMNHQWAQPSPAFKTRNENPFGAHQTFENPEVSSNFNAPHMNAGTFNQAPTGHQNWNEGAEKAQNMNQFNQGQPGFDPKGAYGAQSSPDVQMTDYLNEPPLLEGKLRSSHHIF